MEPDGAPRRAFACSSRSALLVRFTPFTVIDPASNGVNALSMIVPQGWQASGSVQWLPMWTRLAMLNTRVVDPTSRLTVEWLPVQNFMYFTPPAGFDVPLGGNYQGKQYAPPITDPLQFVREFWMPPCCRSSRTQRSSR